MRPLGYVAIWAVLMALLAVTLGVARLHMGALNLPAALLVAAVKAALVLRYFMHLRGGPLVNVVYGVGGFLWVVNLIGGVLADYYDR